MRSTALVLCFATCALVPACSTAHERPRPAVDKAPIVMPVAKTPAPTVIASAPQPVAKPPSRVSFLAVGDTIITRRVGRAMAAQGDVSAPFRSAASLLEAVDFTFANLESPLSVDTPLGGLVAQRFRVVNLANNHIMDGGLERLLLTATRLRAADIATTGVGEDLASAWRPAVITVRDVRIGFVGASYTSKNSSRLVRLPHVARIDHRWELQRTIRALRDDVDFVVASMHAGVEYIRFPAAEQMQFAHTAIDEGADLVIGTHPHVVQRVERYRGRYIFYSLGNFVFDQDRPPEVHESAAVRVTLRQADKGLERLEVIPLVNPDTLSPRPAPTDVAHAILLRMGLTTGLLYEATPPRDSSEARTPGSSSTKTSLAGPSSLP